MKICVITPRYMISGVALAQYRFARALVGQGHDVDLVIGRVDPHLTVPPAPGLNIVTLNKPNVRSLFFPVWRYLRAAKPEVVFSAEDHLNALVLLIAILSGSKAKISGSCRVRPFDTYSNVPFTKRWFLKQVMRAVTWRADALTCVSKDMVEQYRQVFDAPPHVCIYNIIQDKSSTQRMREPVDDPWFEAGQDPVLVAAGTLAPWKGFDDLLDAIAVLKARGRMVRLTILGEGPLRTHLEEKVVSLALSDRVRLPGFTTNTLKYFSRADAFVLSSHVEGLPNVLVEAMMCGLTPVATDCPTGPREVLQDGRYGYLVPVRDPAGLADGIERALAAPIPPEVLAEGVAPFEEQTVIRRHFEVLGLAEPIAA
ncbi:glycosyltransferase [Sphingosinicella sp. BN140058]|uniref:glycosyltransferase n=1 Tax=Sphingosinicella sp. BN140058 TaxID=1892855 RepID=UPI0010118A5C|nr:glycosyltransferase [Sphingosinicella sp. BN140058]QAY77034.1 glycosyltransferase [Sphingosinicella sp. BN140058]